SARDFCAHDIRISANAACMSRGFSCATLTIAATSATARVCSTSVACDAALSVGSSISSLIVVLVFHESRYVRELHFVGVPRPFVQAGAFGVDLPSPPRPPLPPIHQRQRELNLGH